MKQDYPKIYLYKRIVQAKLFIDTRFSDNIDLNNIADEAYFSKFHFIRLFKTIYGKTPHQYLTRVRIENAQVFLQKGISVSETCFRVGFDSVSSLQDFLNTTQNALHLHTSNNLKNGRNK
ncbi:MAG: AraC family transcriptional regulator [Segetibacter sp.]|nr:AraC family transcriptional regulator [Segetibacter sp.]